MLTPNTNELWIEISIPEQRLWLKRGEEVLMDLLISTATNGPGEKNGSQCTPRGWHEIDTKIGEGCEPNTVFVGRVPTGEIYSSQLGGEERGRDWILTRILWLSGLEPGKNQGGDVDTKQRYIYLHGAPDEVELGKPGSIGCVRMRSCDIIRLFDLVPAGTKVLIQD